MTYRSDRSGAGQWKTYWEKADGSGQAEVLFDNPVDRLFRPHEWSPDSRFLVGSLNVSGGADSVVHLDLEDPSSLFSVHYAAWRLIIAA